MILKKRRKRKFKEARDRAIERAKYFGIKKNAVKILKANGLNIHKDYRSIQIWHVVKIKYKIFGIIPMTTYAEISHQALKNNKELKSIFSTS